MYLVLSIVNLCCSNTSAKEFPCFRYFSQACSVSRQISCNSRCSCFAFPIGIGIALVLGVTINYMATPIGDPILLFAGVFIVVVAIIIDALAYNRLTSNNYKSTLKGIVISIIGCILMGFFFTDFYWLLMMKIFSNILTQNLEIQVNVILIGLSEFGLEKQMI